MVTSRVISPGRPTWKVLPVAGKPGGVGEGSNPFVSTLERNRMKWFIACCLTICVAATLYAQAPRAETVRTTLSSVSLDLTTNQVTVYGTSVFPTVVLGNISQERAELTLEVQGMGLPGKEQRYKLTWPINQEQRFITVVGK